MMPARTHRARHRPSAAALRPFVVERRGDDGEGAVDRPGGILGTVASRSQGGRTKSRPHHGQYPLGVLLWELSERVTDVRFVFEAAV